MSAFHRFPLACAAACVVAISVAAPASALVKHEGNWPEADKLVSLDVTNTPRTDALRKLADAAGWNLVVHAPPGDPVEIHVKQTAAAKVLGMSFRALRYRIKKLGIE